MNNSSSDLISPSPLQLLFRKKTWLLIPLFFLIGFLVHAPAIQGPFMTDDTQNITGMHFYYAKGLMATLRHQWTAVQVMQLMPDRPLMVITLWLNYKLFGMEPWGFKVVNIAMHCANGFVFYRLLCLLLNSIPGFPKKNTFALLCSLLYLCHPVHIMAISIIVQRGILMAAFFGMLSLYKWVEYCQTFRQKDFWISWIFLGLSLLSKLNSISFMGIFLLYAFYFGQNSKKRILKTFCFYLLFLPIAFFLYTKNVNFQDGHYTWWEYFVIQTRVVFIYFRLFFIPISAKFLYPISFTTHFLKDFTWLAFLGHASILAAALLLSQRLRLFSFAILSTYAALIPESSFFKFHYVIFEHRTYIPYLFMLAGIAALGTTVSWVRLRNILTVTCMIVFGFLTFSQNEKINSLEKWHYEMSLNYQRDDRLNFLTLDMLFRAKDLERSKTLLDVLERKNSNPAYSFLKTMLLEGPGNTLAENQKIIASHQKIIKNQQFGLISLFLNAANSLIIWVYPENQRDILRHDFFFHQLFYLLKNRGEEFGLISDYKQSLNRLLKNYKTKDPLTPSEELEKERVIAALAVLNAPKGISFVKFFTEMLEKNPNWIVFFE